VIENGQRVWNTWPGYLVQPTYNDVSWFLDLVERRLCGGDRKASEHILDWLAHAIAKPGKKIMHAIVLGGPPTGMGKSTIKTLLGKILPGVRSFSTTNLLEKFQDYVIGMEICFGEEIRAKTIEAANTLKELITEPKIYARRFHQKHIDVLNYANFFITSNYRDPLIIHDKDRRFFVKFTELDADPAYYRQIYALMDARCSDVLGWALRRDLSKFDIYAPPPFTEDARFMVQLTRESEIANIEQQIRERVYPFEHPVMRAGTVLDYLNEHHKARLKDAQLIALFGKEELGGTYLPNVRTPSETAKTGWTKTSFIVFDEPRLSLSNRSGAQLLACVGRSRAELLKDLAGWTKEQVLGEQQAVAAEVERLDAAEGLSPAKPNGNGHARHEPY